MQEQPQWNYQPDTGGPPPAPSPPPGNDEIRWVAPQFTHHDKGIGWFLLLFMGGIGVAAAAYFIARDWLAVVAIAACTIIAAIAGGRRPSDVEYALSDRSIQVGNRSFGYGDFRSYAVVNDEAGRRIVVTPLKRFVPPVTLHYAPEQEAAIVQVLSAILPHEDHQPDSIDRLSRRLRF